MPMCPAFHHIANFPPRVRPGFHAAVEDGIVVAALGDDGFAKCCLGSGAGFMDCGGRDEELTLVTMWNDGKLVDGGVRVKMSLGFVC